MAYPLHAARAAGSSLASMGRRRLDDLLDVLDLLLERQNGHLTPAQREQIAARASADKASRDSFAAVMVVLLLILACLTCAALGLCLAIKLGRRPRRRARAATRTPERLRLKDMSTPDSSQIVVAESSEPDTL